jgi:hypothetical protein
MSDHGPYSDWDPGPFQPHFAPSKLDRATIQLPAQGAIAALIAPMFQSRSIAVRLRNIGYGAGS